MSVSNPPPAHPVPAVGHAEAVRLYRLHRGANRSRAHRLDRVRVALTKPRSRGLMQPWELQAADAIRACAVVGSPPRPADFEEFARHAPDRLTAGLHRRTAAVLRAWIAAEAVSE